MEQHFLNIYLTIIRQEMEFAKFAFDKYFSLKARAPIDNKELFYQIHQFLIHCANLHKILFPKVRKKGSGSIKQIKKDRENDLRKIFNNYPKMNFSYFREARNHFEHFDERIDSWILHSTRHNFVDMNISDVDIEKAIGGINKEDYFRNINIKNDAFFFAGKKYELSKMYNTILELQKYL